MMEDVQLSNLGFEVHSELYYYLLEHGLMEQYVRNHSYAVNVVDGIRSSSRIHRVSSAFAWVNTPEGHDFWSSIADHVGGSTMSDYDVVTLEEEYPEYFV